MGRPGSAAGQVRAAREIAPVVAVQNHYNIEFRQDDEVVEYCAAHGIAFAPFFPLGGFRPLQVQALDQVAWELGCTARQVTLAWLLRRSPSMLLIPGTSRIAHLRENIKAATIELPDVALSSLDAIAG